MDWSVTSSIRAVWPARSTYRPIQNIASSLLLSIMARVLDDVGRRDRGGDGVRFGRPLLDRLLARVLELLVAVVGGVLDPLVLGLLHLCGRGRAARGGGALGSQHPGVLRPAAAGGVHDHLSA